MSDQNKILDADNAPVQATLSPGTQVEEIVNTLSGLPLGITDAGEIAVKVMIVQLPP